jgi:hypothetical protein
MKMQSQQCQVRAEGRPLQAFEKLGATLSGIQTELKAMRKDVDAMKGKPPAPPKGEKAPAPKSEPSKEKE